VGSTPTLGTKQINYFSGSVAPAMSFATEFRFEAPQEIKQRAVEEQ